jgi:hypothetical protein
MRRTMIGLAIAVLAVAACAPQPPKAPGGTATTTTAAGSGASTSVADTSTTAPVTTTGTSIPTGLSFGCEANAWVIRNNTGVPLTLRPMVGGVASADIALPKGRRINPAEGVNPVEVYNGAALVATLAEPGCFNQVPLDSLGCDAGDTWRVEFDAVLHSQDNVAGSATGWVITNDGAWHAMTYGNVGGEVMFSIGAVEPRPRALAITSDARVGQLTSIVCDGTVTP